jgi:hypothetical protein
MSSKDLETSMLAFRSTPHELIMDSPDWLAFELLPETRLVSVNKPESTQTGIWLHVAQASSERMTDERSFNRNGDIGPSTVQISLYFLIVVVCFNSFKLIIMLSVLVTDRSAYLVTLGDAASSFLRRKDSYTDNMCILGREEILSDMCKSANDRYYSNEEAKALCLRLKGQWLQLPRPYYHRFGPSHQRFKFFTFCS